MCAPGADFQPVIGSVTLAAGQTTKKITIAMCPDTAVEGDEIFTVTLTGPSTGVGNPASATVKVQDNDGSL